MTAMKNPAWLRVVVPPPTRDIPPAEIFRIREPAMKSLRPMFVICVVLIAALGSAIAQTWTPLTHQPTFAASTALLLTDGRVLVQGSGARAWSILTPDATGSYINGTWKRAGLLPAGYAPLYYASAVLPDGRVVVIGGEYNLGQEVWTTLGAVYDPTTNKWAPLSAPSGWKRVGDAQSVILADGTFMVADCCTTQEALLDANTLTWTSTGAGKADINDEEGWTLLPGGEVLTVDTNTGSNTSEIYNPASGSWSSAGNTVVDLIDHPTWEVGPAILRPDGTVLATGATGHNAIYNTATGAWSAAPDFPAVKGKLLAMADAPAALLPDGNVLCMTAPGVYGIGVQFFEWDGAHFNPTASTPNAAHEPAYYGRMVVLPTGQVLLTDESLDAEIYTSVGAPNPAWAPVITSYSPTLTRGKTSTVSGLQFNGLSQAAFYGDDAQSATNYPLVRITNTATGHAFYARTFNHSSMGVATGSLTVKTNFQVSPRTERGPSHLEVVANGIASTPVSVTIN
jgi:hypothetical protein